MKCLVYKLHCDVLVSIKLLVSAVTGKKCVQRNKICLLWWWLVKPMFPCTWSLNDVYMYIISFLSLCKTKVSSDKLNKWYCLLKLRLLSEMKNQSLVYISRKAFFHWSKWIWTLIYLYKLNPLHFKPKACPPLDLLHIIILITVCNNRLILPQNASYAPLEARRSQPREHCCHTVNFCWFPVFFLSVFRCASWFFQCQSSWAVWETGNPTYGLCCLIW